MIPRYDGLVPAIRGPTSSAAASKAASSVNKTPTIVTRFTIRPTPSAPNDTTHSASASTAAGSAEPERRLYTFLPSADVLDPPKELRVASYFFGDADNNNSAARIAEADEGSEESDDDDDTVGMSGDGSQQKGRAAQPSSTPAAAVANGAVSGEQRGQGQRRRRRRRGQEPMRLEYQGILDAHRANPYAERSVKVASTPVPSYRHLTCVLLELPSGWRDSEESQESRTAPAPAVAASKDISTTVADAHLVTATPLARPILQLWGERKEASAVHASAGSSGTRSSATGISTSWYSEQSTRISKKDWKTMDAEEAEMHKPTNWSDDDGGAEDDVDGSSPETALAARERKKAKAEATSQAERSYLAGTRAALRQLTANPLEEERETGNALDGTTPERAAVAKPEVSARELSSTTPHAGRTVTLRKPSPLPPAASTAAPVAPKANAATTSASAPLSSSPSPVVVSAPPAPSAAETVASDASLTLSALAAAVLEEVRRQEKRATAPLMELQKRILKQLPDFAIMNQKIKSATTKKEAVEWFQTRQRELRVWLQGQGHTIASDNTVTFGV